MVFRKERHRKGEVCDVRGRAAGRDRGKARKGSDSEGLNGQRMRGRGGRGWRDISYGLLRLPIPSELAMSDECAKSLLIWNSPVKTIQRNPRHDENVISIGGRNFTAGREVIAKGKC